MSSQYIFTMHRLSKLHPPDKTVLEQHHAGVLPGREDRRARLQRRGQVDAAADHGRRRPGVPRRGRARPGRDGGDARAGARPRRGQGRQGQRRGRRRRDQGAARPLQRARRQLLRGDRRGVRRLQAKIDAADAWNLDTQLEYAMDALRLPPGRRRGEHPLGRRAPPRRALPAAAARARPAAARRAHQPPRRRVGGLARAAPRRVQGHRRGGHPRPLLPRQRRRLDPRARPRQGHPLRGQLLELARAEAGAPGPGGALGEGAPAHDRRRARMGAHEPQGPAHEVQGAPGPLRAAGGRGAQRQARRGPDPHPARPAPGRAGAHARPTLARATATAC